jgi:hypothetical protein
MHQSIPEQGSWLRQVVTGHFAYYAAPTNARALSAFRQYVTDLWRRTLRRRSHKDGVTWARMSKLADSWLPAPRILRPWPDQRFAVTHPRQELDAQIGLVQICAGVLGNEHPYREPRSSSGLPSIERARLREAILA